jgi:hypothetical protein
MTMHLEGPWLSSLGKKKGKTKFRNAEEAARHRALTAEWEKMMKTYDSPSKTKQKVEKLSYSLTTPPGRITNTHIKSLDTGHTGAVASKAIPQYTGTKMLGIGTMHKSNAVPIFTDEEAKSISSMRR